MNAEITDFQATIPAEDYMTGFRDAPRFLSLCKKCGNFGKLWACPPFEKDWTAELRRYSLVTVFATKIEPTVPGISMTEVSGLFRKERMRIEPWLRELEKQTGGLAFAFAGECLYCPRGTCARTGGNPCRHPELVRPSLEAAGFDIGKTTAELFDLPLLWSKDGLAPDYFVLVCGLFHDDDIMNMI